MTRQGGYPSYQQFKKPKKFFLPWKPISFPVKNVLFNINFFFFFLIPLQLPSFISLAVS